MCLGKDDYTSLVWEIRGPPTVGSKVKSKLENSVERRRATLKETIKYFYTRMAIF